jgi:hypothetical protein
MKRLVKHRRWVSLLVCAMAGIALGMVLVPSGPHDPPIPADLPDESNRVRHPQGFSIVLPRNWNVVADDFDHSTASIIGTPRMSIPVRAPVGISVIRLGPDEPDLSTGFHPVEFQGMPALERQAVRPISSEHGPQFTYDLVFRREGCWYRVGYDHPGQIQSLPDVVRQYLLTFTIDGRREPPP